MRLSKQYTLWFRNISRSNGKPKTGVSLIFIEYLDLNHFGISKYQVIWARRSYQARWYLLW